jgi:hypothetical protein
MIAKKLHVLAALLILGVAMFALWLLWHAPPLRPSSDYSVTYFVAGELHSDAQLFRPIGFSARYYIFVPSPAESRYRWFAVDFGRHLAARPAVKPRGPFGGPSINRDQPIGILLTQPKIEDTWEVSFTERGVHFSNATLSVSLAKQP